MFLKENRKVLFFGISFIYLVSCTCNNVTEERAFRNSLIVNENWYLLTTDEKSYKDCPSLFGDNSTISLVYQNWLLRYSGNKTEKRNISKIIRVYSGAFDYASINGKLLTITSVYPKTLSANLYNPETNQREYLIEEIYIPEGVTDMGITRFDGWVEEYQVMMNQATFYRHIADYVHIPYKGRKSSFFIMDLKNDTIINLDMTDFFSDIKGDVVWYDLRCIDNEIHGLYYKESDSTLNVVKQKNISESEFISSVPFNRERHAVFCWMLFEDNKYVGIYVSDDIEGSEAFYEVGSEWDHNPPPLSGFYQVPWDSIDVIDNDEFFGFYQKTTGDTLKYPPIKDF
ncbi:MAG: hypothetical protein HQK83_06345 [Fibrobacteria bacterium]|nr:hypothetical protein [Fibrobacteria bacterium]